MGPGAIKCAEDSLSNHQQDVHKMPIVAGVNISDVFVLCKNLRGEIKLEAKTTVIHQVGCCVMLLSDYDIFNKYIIIEYKHY